jgi:SAM-dependent methyltransferase
VWAESLRALLALRPGLRVADLGCGAGQLGRLLWPALAPHGRVHGFDADPAQLSLARTLGLPGGQFEEADARDVPRRDGSYDRVVCQALLVHQSRPREFIREMVRLTRAGGLVAAIEPLLPVSSEHPAIEPDQEAQAARAHALAAHAAVESGLGSWSIAQDLPQLFADCGLDFVVSSPHPGVFAVLAGSRGTPEQRLLRTLTDPAEERAERELQDALSASAGAVAEDLRALKAYRHKVRDARRAGLRADTWWEWRRHPLLVCVGRKGAV